MKDTGRGGSKFLPAHGSLDRVYHVEDDGLFRFGRPVYDEEKLVFSNKKVLVEFGIALEEMTSFLKTA